MYHKILIPILITTFLITGCIGRAEFTPAIKKEIETSGADLSGIQYYNSEDILLVRQLKYSNVKVTKGIVVEKNGKYLNQIRIEKNTSGILIKKEGADKLFISFENGLYLPFEKPKYYGNYFKLSPDRIERGNSFVKYGDSEYEIIGKSKLLYRPFKRNKTKSKHHSAKGMKVDDHPFNLKSKIEAIKSKRTDKKQAKAKDEIEGEKKEKGEKGKKQNDKKIKKKRLEKKPKKKTKSTINE